MIIILYVTQKVDILTLLGIVGGYTVITSGFNFKGRMEKLREKIHSLNLSIIINGVFKYICLYILLYIYYYIYILLFNGIYNTCKGACGSVVVKALRY
jgi:hypothetical protein